MKSLKTKRIFVLIWIILSSSSLVSLFMLLQGITIYSSNPLVFWSSFFKIITTGILVTMSISLWTIVKNYTEKNKWQSQYYQSVKQLGYWSIALNVLNPFIQVGYITLYLKTPAKFLILRTFASVLWESPAMWILTLTIFLFAELLHVANQIKAENESII